MLELTAELADRGTVVAPFSISRWLIRNGYRFKKAAGQRTGSTGHRKAARRMGGEAPAEDAA